MTLYRDRQMAQDILELGEDEFLARWEAMSEEQRVYIAGEAQRIGRAAEDPTPGHLALRLDPMQVQTPALAILDEQLIQVRNSLAVMFERRAIYSEMVRKGMDEQEAVERASEMVPEQGTQRLIVSMPPQEGKSWRISIFGMLWLLRQFPMLKIGIVSYDGGNAEQFSRQIRNLIETFDGSDGSIDLGLRLMKDQKAMSRWQLESGGSIFATGIGGALTGRHLDLILIDDPVKDAKNADSVLLSAQAWEWWQTVGRTRLAPGAPAIVVATRWHEADLSGRLIAKQFEDAMSGTHDFDHWRVINIPAQADHRPELGERDILGRQPGDFMVSARGRTISDWQKQKTGTETRFWNALYQGRPTPDKGDILEREWWIRYDSTIVQRMPEGTFRVPGHDLWLSIDCTFKGTAGTDFVVIQAWAKKGPDSFLVAQIRRRMSFTETVDSIRHLLYLLPGARAKIIEAKANGEAVMDVLRKDVPGLLPANPTESKEARARAGSLFVRSGNFHIPTKRVAAIHPELAFNPDDFLDEATSFPRGTHDDQVDAWSQYAAEAYLVGGAATISVPTGQMPTGGRGRAARVPTGQGKSQALSPVQRRLAEQSRAPQK